MLARGDTWAYLFNGVYLVIPNISDAMDGLLRLRIDTLLSPPMVHVVSGLDDRDTRLRRCGGRT